MIMHDIPFLNQNSAATQVVQGFDRRTVADEQAGGDHGMWDGKAEGARAIVGIIHPGENVGTTRFQIMFDRLPRPEAQFNGKAQDIGHGLDQLDVEARGPAVVQVFIGRVGMVRADDEHGSVSGPG